MYIVKFYCFQFTKAFNMESTTKYSKKCYACPSYVKYCQCPILLML